MRRFFAAIMTIVAATTLFAQSINARNALEFRGAKEGHSHFENRTTMEFSWDNFAVGGLYWAREPSRFDFATSSDTTFADMFQYYFDFYTNSVQMRAGSFTHTQGQGLVLDLYERQDLQIDHHVDGAKFALSSDYLELTGFNGIARWDDNSIVRGFSPTFKYEWLRLGGNYMLVDPQISLSQEAWSASAATDFEHFSAYGEYAKKSVITAGDEGTGIFASASVLLDFISLTGEYKYYDNFIIRTSNRQYNNPPSLIMEPTYTLPGLHIRQLDASDETGFSINALSNPGQFKFEAFYCHAQTNDDTRKFDQFWLSSEYHNEDETFVLKLAGDYQKNVEDNTITPIVDITWSPDWSLYNYNLSVEYQKTEDFTNIFSVATVSYGGAAAIGLEAGRIEDDDFLRGFADIDVIDHAKIRLGYGKKPGGFICSGGVCRFEQPFEGFEGQLILTF